MRAAAFVFIFFLSLCYSADVSTATPVNIKTKKIRAHMKTAPPIALIQRGASDEPFRSVSLKTKKITAWMKPIPPTTDTPQIIKFMPVNVKTPKIKATMKSE